MEWALAQNVIEALCPGCDEASFIEQRDLDGIVTHYSYEKEWLDPRTFVDEWGVVKRMGDEEYPMPVDGPIRVMKDLERYAPPPADKAMRYQAIQSALDRFDGKKAVVLHANDVFSLPCRLMSFERFMIALHEDPLLAEGLISLTVDVNWEMAKRARAMGVKIIMTGDDYAYNNAPMMSPGLFQALFHPYFKKIIRAYKSLGFYVIKHSDGNIAPLLDMIMDSDIDCIDPIQPVPGMSLEAVKKAYGGRCCIKGNVDCAHTLTFGSVRDVREEVARCMRAGKPGYGYICSSSNSIHSAVPPGLYAAMLDAIKEYGAYEQAAAVTEEVSPCKNS